MEPVVVAVLALAVGAVLGWVTQHWRTKAQAGTAAVELERTRATLEATEAQVAQLDPLKRAKDESDAALVAARTDLAGIRATSEAQAKDVERLTRDLSQVQGDLDRARNTVTAKQAELAGQQAMTKALGADVQDRDQRLAQARADLAAVREQLKKAQDEARTLHAQIAEQGARAETNAKAADEKLQLLQGAREALGNQFKVLAAEILKAQSQQFGADSSKAISSLLEPVKTKLGEFQQKVESFQAQHQTTAASLQTELKHLGEVSGHLTAEAAELTQALTTRSQVRGAWGEQVLRRVLEVAGLREGPDFAVQESHRLADGTLPRPDVIVNLPGGRRIVVDSKLSLNDYLAHTAATSDDERDAALKRHVGAVRQHVRELSAKDYTQLLGTNTLDFVIAFVPIEQAYLAAVEADNSLYDEAWQRHVMFACPSTLLYALRMVSYLWTQEAQRQNVSAIVQRGAELYDKFVNFSKDLLGVGAALASARNAYEGAVKKLSSGRGNLVRQVEMLRELGVKPSKQIAGSLLDEAAAVDLEGPASSALATAAPSASPTGAAARPEASSAVGAPAS